MFRVRHDRSTRRGGDAAAAGRAVSKHVVGAGPWQIRRSDAGQPFYCVILEGGCRLALDGHEPVELQAGDFALIPAAFGVAMSSLEPPAGTADSMPVALGQGLFRIGAQEGPTDLRILAGHCSFGSPDAACWSRCCRGSSMCAASSGWPRWCSW
jgi:hypothetical protein